MSLIKICGLFREEDIEYANVCMPDYVGFVFAESKRRISPAMSAAFKAALHPRIQSVGVFVNERIDIIAELCEQKIINLVQLHGEEDAAYVASLRKRIKNPIIKAVAVHHELTVPTMDVEHFLFDAFRAGQRGGTGESFHWDLVKNYEKPYFLAGGIHVGNVAKAIRNLKPYCIDVSSGVETNGVKDFDKMQAITIAVRNSRDD